MSFRKSNSSGPNPPKGTKVSVFNQQVLTSSGIQSLDELLGGGIPVGRVLLIKQDRFSGYSNLILKYFLRQGIQCQHEILLASVDSAPQDMITDLMGLSNGQSTGIDADADFIPAVNGIAGRSLGQLRTVKRGAEGNLDIAWRYQGLRQHSHELNSNGAQNTSNVSGGIEFCHTYDLTKRISPEILRTAKVTIINEEYLNCIPPNGTNGSGGNYGKVTSAIREKLVEKHFSILAGSSGSKSNLIRIGINAVGTEFWDDSKDSFLNLCSMLYKLKASLRNKYAVAVVTIPAYLFDEYQNHSSNVMISRLDYSVDAVINIESFAGTLSFDVGSQQPMNPLYTSDYHGLIHPLHLFQVNSILQSTRLSNVKLHSLGFKVRRKRFSIEPFTLPPEAEQEESEQANYEKGVGSSNGCFSGTKKDPLAF